MRCQCGVQAHVGERSGVLKAALGRRRSLLRVIWIQPNSEKHEKARLSRNTAPYYWGTEVGCFLTRNICDIRAQGGFHSIKPCYWNGNNESSFQHLHSQVTLLGSTLAANPKPKDIRSVWLSILEFIAAATFSTLIACLLSIYTSIKFKSNTTALLQKIDFWLKRIQSICEKCFCSDQQKENS